MASSMIAFASMINQINVLHVPKGGNEAAHSLASSMTLRNEPFLFNPACQYISYLD